MKRTTLLLTCVIVSLEMAMAQCNAFFPMREKLKLYYDHYDRKDKLSLKTTQQLVNISGSGASMKGTMVQELIDPKKDDLIGKYESLWNCENGTLHFDMHNVAFSDPAMSGNGMAMDVTGDPWDVPPTLSVGQKLRDINYSMRMSMNGVPLMNRAFEVTERKVESEEKITTPAGTFTCYKLSFLSKSSGGIGGGAMRTIMWYAKDIGLVKSEAYGEKGNLVAKQILSKVENK